MSIFLSLFLSILPVIILLGIIYYHDKFEKEPIKMLALSFFAGAVATIPIILVETLLKLFGNFSGHFISGAYNAFIVAGLTEECFKFFCLYLIIWKSKYFNEYFDGIVYAVFVSLGFACVENTMYVFGYGLSVVPYRSILSVPAHFFFGAIMGYYFSLAKFIPQKRKSYLLKSLLYPVIFHGLYDAFIFWSETLNTGLSLLMLTSLIIFVIILWIEGIKRISKLKKMPLPSTEQEIDSNENADVVDKVIKEKRSLSYYLKIVGAVLIGLYGILHIVNMCFVLFSTPGTKKNQTEQYRYYPEEDSCKSNNNSRKQYNMDSLLNEEQKRIEDKYQKAANKKKDSTSLIDLFPDTASYNLYLRMKKENEESK